MNRRVVLILLIYINLQGVLAQSTWQVQAPYKANQWLYLSGLYGAKQLFIDSIGLDHTGQARYRVPSQLPQGVYLLSDTSGAAIELLYTGAPSLRIEAQSPAWQQARLLDDRQNILAQAYYARAQALRQALATLDQQLAWAQPDDRPELEHQRNVILQQAAQYRDSIHRLPNVDFFRHLVQAQEPVPQPVGFEHRSPSQQQHFVQMHFFDSLALHDNRLLHSPVVFGRLQQFFEQVLHPHPDTAVAYALALYHSWQAWPAYEQYLFEYLLQTERFSQRIGMEKTWIAVLDTFYHSQAPRWMTEQQYALVRQRADALRPTLVGARAPDWVLTDARGHALALADIDALYTLLLFWTPDCEHCLQSLPGLATLYSQYRTQGLEVVAIYTGADTASWQAAIRQHRLEWPNVYAHAAAPTVFRQYAIRRTPSLFLLDQAKRIVLKDFEPETLALLLRDLFDARKP